MNDQQYEEKMTRIAADRQTAIDEMRLKLQTGGSGI